MKKILKVILVLIAAVPSFYLIAILVALSSWPIDSTMSVGDFFTRSFLPTFWYYICSGIVAGILIWIIAKIVHTFILKDKTSKFPQYLSLLIAGTIVIVSSILSIWIWYSDKGKIVETTLEMGRLADIPKSASELKYGKNGNFFSNGSFVTFKINPNDLYQFIQNSPGLNDVKPETINANNRYLQPPKFSGSRFTWYTPQNVRTGKLYKLPQDEKANSLTLVVDDESHVIYIQIIHS